MLVDMGGILSSGGGQAIEGNLAPDSVKYHNSLTNTTTYAGVQLNNDGNQYYAEANGAWSQEDSPYWLINGANTDFWVRATVTSGSLDWENAGTGSWLALSTTRSWGIQDTSAGAIPELASLKLELATDSGGSNIVATVTYTLSAWNDSGV